jgi:hypothetical protein
MSDVSVSLGVTGKDAVLGAFSSVSTAGKQMGETFGSIAGKLAGLAAGYLSITAAAGAFNAVMAKGGQLSDFSDQTGIAVDKLVILERAFENNGMKAEDLGSIVNKMQKTLTAAGDEGSAAADKIGRLGLKVSDLQVMTPDKQFETIAKAIANIQDPTERAASAMEIFGKSGGRTLALFNDFDSNISQAKSEVGSFAEEMQNNAKSFDAIGDGITEIGSKLVEFTAGLLGDSIPAMTTLVSYFKSVDATAFGKAFSESLSQGISIALSIFTNPGNLFLAFGDSLVLAFKTGGNALYSGVQYVFEWASNYFQAIVPNWSSLLKAEFTAAFGYVASGFTGMLAEVFSGIAGYLPEKLGRPMAEIGNKLAQTSDEWSNKAAAGLAQAWDGISSAAEKATEQTHLQNEDYFDAAGSAATLQEHLTVARESGDGILAGMKDAVDQAKLITDEANAWDKAMDSFSQKLTGATDNFKQFAALGDAEANTLGSMSGIAMPSGGGNVGPLATAADRKSAAASSRSARESFQSGKAPSLADTMKSLLHPEDYVSATGTGRRSWDAIEQTLGIRAGQQTASDLSYYTGGDANASNQQAIDDLFRKYQNDIGGNPADLRKKAEDDFNALMNAKLQGVDANGNATGPGSSGGASGPKNAGAGQDPLGQILTAVNAIKKFMDDNMPQHALS